MEVSVSLHLPETLPNLSDEKAFANTWEGLGKTLAETPLFTKDALKPLKEDRRVRVSLSKLPSLPKGLTIGLTSPRHK